MDGGPEELGRLRDKLVAGVGPLNSDQAERVLRGMLEVSQDQIPTREHLKELIQEQVGMAGGLEAAQDNSDLDGILDDIKKGIDGLGDIA